MVGKVLSPMTLSIQTIVGAMRPAWGNPVGLKFKTIGERDANMFVVEFGTLGNRDTALAGSPWIIGRHSVLLKMYDGKLSADEVSFDKMELWVRILNLPLGWMNDKKGRKPMELLGEVIKMDVDGDGKACGAFLHARVIIDVLKPIRRGILLRLSRLEEPKWFAAQYEKVPFFCFSCGLMGHSELECPTPAHRVGGRLPYQIGPPIRAPKDRR